MAPLKFEKLVCGSSVDLFKKDFAHENAWELEQSDAQKGSSFVNNIKLSKDSSIHGSTLAKCNIGPANVELKVQVDGKHYLELSAAHSKYTPVTFHAKGEADVPKGIYTGELAADHVLPVHSCQVKVNPFARDYSAFSLTRLNLCSGQLLVGTEITGRNCAFLSNYTSALGYKKEREDKTYAVSARLFGARGYGLTSLLGNVYAGKAHGSAQNAFSVALEHSFKDTNTKLRFAGLWHITEPNHPNPAYVKGKCDTDGNFAVTVFQRFNNTVAGALGVSFNAKESLSPSNVNYGLKMVVS
ncbi:eukaryotic porin, putative [Babesia ovata]|uniref:Eukaryotic porin, putative n=1 Tax=Babesia ovata TaxID=189622 RepID=A0A2H6K930_9APIC|nr:eukaryotic porin, putative [Babesia ovata]GBE59493.1 eukaryotic porin, putative [Babesia ovata]